MNTVAASEIENGSKYLQLQTSMLSPCDKLTDVGALELRHANIVELEGFTARREDLPRPRLLHDLVEHDLQFPALACALLAALVVQHLRND
jgi:hypothetical protein